MPLRRSRVSSRHEPCRRRGDGQTSADVVTKLLFDAEWERFTSLLELVECAIHGKLLDDGGERRARVNGCVPADVEKSNNVGVITNGFVQQSPYLEKVLSPLVVVLLVLPDCLDGNHRLSRLGIIELRALNDERDCIPNAFTAHDASAMSGEES